jgi:hypothetical protein
LTESEDTWWSFLYIFKALATSPDTWNETSVLN